MVTVISRKLGKLHSRQDWGKALAVQQMAPPLSLILGPMMTVFLLNWFSWRAPMVVIAITER